MRVESAAIAFYHRLVSGTWPDDLPVTGQEGAAVREWDHLCKYLSGCGFAGALTEPDIAAEMAAWAPTGFVEALQRRATGDALRELAHRDALDQIHQALTEENIRGILLKGAAIYLQEQAQGIRPARVPGDIDIWIESAEAASTLRQRLIAAGFAGDVNAPRTAPHHLAPVTWRNSAVEIHTAPMPSIWGLPTAAFAADACPVERWPQFYTLNTQHMALHEVIHAASHLWSFGLKLPYDLLRIQRFSSREIDWSQVATLAARTNCPRAFWAPLRALSAKVSAPDLPFPVKLIKSDHAPKGAHKAETHAAQRMFSSIEDADSINPFQKNMLFLSLYQGRKKLCYLTYLSGREASEARRAALQSTGGQGWKNLPAQFKDLCRDILRRRR